MGLLSDSVGLIFVRSRVQLAEDLYSDESHVGHLALDPAGDDVDCLGHNVASVVLGNNSESVEGRSLLQISCIVVDDLLKLWQKVALDPAWRLEFEYFLNEWILPLVVCCQTP